MGITQQETCPHLSDPAGCLSHRRTYFASLPPADDPRLRVYVLRGPDCSNCKAGRAHQEAVPPPTAYEGREELYTIDPADFLDEPPPVKIEKRGRLPRTRCPKGHSDWGWRNQNGKKVRYCLACNRERVERQREHRRKGPKKSFIDYRRTA